MDKSSLGQGFPHIIKGSASLAFEAIEVTTNARGHT